MRYRHRGRLLWHIGSVHVEHRALVEGVESGESLCFTVMDWRLGDLKMELAADVVRVEEGLTFQMLFALELLVLALVLLP